MSLGYILSQAGKKMGLNPSDSQERSVLLRFANEAMREAYMQCDPVGSLMEAVFKVNGNQTVSLPQYVGFVRAIRELCSWEPWHLKQMRPRYNQFNWPDSWRGWRLRNRQALMATVVNQSVGVITVPFVETPNIVVTVSGPTALASRATESVIMSSTVMKTQNQYMDYVTVQKDRANDYDVSLVDIDNNPLTVIPNTELTAQYQIVDVSDAPWLSQSTAPMENYMEVLFKKTLPLMTNDNDEFPAPNYDDIIVNKIMQLWGEEQGKADMAVGYATKATQTMVRLKEENNRGAEDMIALSANGHDTLNPRIGGGRNRRWLYNGRF